MCRARHHVVNSQRPGRRSITKHLVNNPVTLKHAKLLNIPESPAECRVVRLHDDIAGLRGQQRKDLLPRKANNTLKPVPPPSALRHRNTEPWNPKAVTQSLIPKSPNYYLFILIRRGLQWLLPRKIHIIYINLYIYMCIYIYIERERATEWPKCMLPVAQLRERRG